MGLTKHEQKHQYLTMPEFNHV